MRRLNKSMKEGRFWPDALLSLNPRYEAGPTADELVNSGDICPETAQVFPFRSEAASISQASGAGLRQSAGGTEFRCDHGDRLGQIPLFFRSDRGCHHPCTEGWLWAKDTHDHRIPDERTR